MRRVERGTLFVALMFIGMGIGMIFDRADVGTMIGLGAGFIALSLIPKEEKGAEESGRTEGVRGVSGIGRLIGSVVLALIGVGFIIGGLYMLGLISIPLELGRYFGAVILLLLGLFFLAWSLRYIK